LTTAETTQQSILRHTLKYIAESRSVSLPMSGEVTKSLAWL